MRKVLLIMILLFLPLVARADFDFGKWRYYKEINFDEQGLKSFIVDEEIYSKANSKLSDLRIIDENNTEIPYRLAIDRSSYTAGTYYPELLSSGKAGAVMTVILDFGENYEEINQMLINTATENFFNNVKIFGSNTRYGWRLIEDSEYVYDVTDRLGDFRAYDMIVDFPTGNYRYYRLQIINSQGSLMEIASVEASNEKQLEGVERIRKPDFKIQENKNSQTTLVIIDLGSHGIPTHKITLDIEDADFFRGLTIFRSYDGKNWSVKGTGYIFRTNTEGFKSENIEINYNEANNQYLKLVIRNKDNEPITINNVKVHSIDRKLTFWAKTDKEYRVFYGNTQAKYPQYNLKKAWGNINTSNTEIASLSRMKYNINFVSIVIPIFSLWQEIWQYLLAGLLILFVGILIIFVFRYFEKK